MPIFLLARHHLSACRPRYWSKRLFFAPAPSTGTANDPKSLAPDESKWCARSLSGSAPDAKHEVQPDSKASLAGASELETLELTSANVTASGYANLKGLRKLMSISFRKNPTVEDSWLTEIAKLTQVHYLYLTCPQFTDAGLVHLQTASGLRELDLRGSGVTKEGVELLKTFLPKCKITGP